MRSVITSVPMRRFGWASFLAILSISMTAGAQDVPPPPPPADQPVPEPPAADTPPPPPPAYGGAAATPPPPPPPPPPGTVAEAPGAYRHDGLYLRMALGVGGIGVDRTVKSEEVSGEFESEIDGGGLGVEVTIGGTPAAGLVIGGMWLIQSIGDAVVVPKDGGEETTLENGFLISLMAAVLDWYPWADGGFHFGGGLGWLLASGRLPADSIATTELGIERIGGGGWGLTIHAGYDFWIGEQWSLGPALRFVFGGTHGETIVSSRDVRVEEDDGITALLLSFNATLH